MRPTNQLLPLYYYYCNLKLSKIRESPFSKFRPSDQLLLKLVHHQTSRYNSKIASERKKIRKIRNSMRGRQKLLHNFTASYNTIEIEHLYKANLTFLT